MPAYGGSVNPSSAKSAWLASYKGYVSYRGCKVKGASLLAHNFNHYWVEALHGPYTHFAMIHSDISLCDGWLDVMVDSMERHECHVLSVVSPIKDDRAKVSTAIDVPGRPWNPRVLSRSDISKLPQTFGEEDLFEAGLADLDESLLVNTGAMVVDLQHAQIRRMEGEELALHFEIKDRILVTDERPPRFVPQVFSEDWGFSRTANRLGMKVMATTEVDLVHFGSREFTNRIDRKICKDCVKVEGGPLDGEEILKIRLREHSQFPGEHLYFRSGRAHRFAVKDGTAVFLGFPGQ